MGRAPRRGRVFSQGERNEAAGKSPYGIAFARECTTLEDKALGQVGNVSSDSGGPAFEQPEMATEDEIVAINEGVAAREAVNVLARKNPRTMHAENKRANGKRNLDGGKRCQIRGLCVEEGRAIGRENGGYTEAYIGRAV